MPAGESGRKPKSCFALSWRGHHLANCNVRDVLATHILKQTRSYEQASCAFQNTPEMVANQYGGFLPQDTA
ncbi:hypothetical protein B0E45_04045 [Sinorhizobium sp. A49]|nr:hypothetical protein B0E45_04045 [Sinorhizobium sp. A49]